ncbi:MAG: cellulose-binding protein [bacterium]|nr:cellulose-binding protein [bacterium]
MPLGDSITEAETGFASYRYWLWQDLISAGYDVDFVGSMTGNFGGPPLFEDFDQDHEGHWGWRADEVLAEIDGWAAAALPDVVLLHLGTNDLWQGQDIPGTLAELEAIVEAIRVHVPGVAVLLAQLIPSTVGALSGIPDLNAEIPALAATLSTPESPVLVVDQFTGFDPAVDTYDGVHPDESGELAMAGNWLAGLELLIEPVAIIFEDGFESGDMSGWGAPTPSIIVAACPLQPVVTAPHSCSRGMSCRAQCPFE